MEKISSMLFSVKLPKPKDRLLLSEYVSFTCIENDVPQKVWSCKKVNYSQLKLFGCKAFVHVPKEQQVKFDARAEECIVFGCSDEQFGYRL